MPTYGYKCTRCGNYFDVFHGVNETVESCEDCGGKLRRVFHPVGIIFKGSGFYKTDSRKAGDNGGKTDTTSDKPWAESEKQSDNYTDKGKGGQGGEMGGEGPAQRAGSIRD